MIRPTLKNEVANLGLEDRKELMGYMAGLQMKEDDAYLQTLAVRIDDNNPANWVSLDQLDGKLP